ncbi:unnamed protein product [Calypogeia fissa]
MDRLSYIGYPDDAEVDALLSQLSDDSLLKLKVNTHNTSSRAGFEYPTFTDGWVDDDATEALDTQLSSRFSSLKRPIAPAAAKKKGKDSVKVGDKKVASNLDRGALGGGKKSNKSSRDNDKVVGNNVNNNDSRESPLWDMKGRDSDVVGWRGSDLGDESSRGLSGKSSSRTSSRRKGEEDGSSGRRHQQQNPIKKDERSRGSSGSSRRTEVYSFKKSSAGEGEEDEEDLDSIDAVLNERFRALKATPPASSSSTTSSSTTAPSTGNLDLDNLLQISGQLSTNDYESYGSPFSIPSSPSPSANLLGRYKSRSSPRVMTSSVATSCHCSTPSPLRLLKQVGSKSFPSKQQQQPSPGSLPPSSPAPNSSPAVKKQAGRQFKVEGFGNSKQGFGNAKPTGKESSEKHVTERKEKSEKIERKSSSEESTRSTTNPSTMKDMRRLISSVADRVGLERSRVSSAVDDELYPGEDLNVWSVVDDDEEQEFARASTEEEKLNREAERVVEWAKDAARLGPGGDSDMDVEVDPLEEDRLDVDDDDDADDAEDSNVRKPSKKEKPKRKGIKVAPKKKWILF